MLSGALRRARGSPWPTPWSREALTPGALVAAARRKPIRHRAAGSKEPAADLLAAEDAAEARHHVATSVGGVERLKDTGCFQALAARERLIREGCTPQPMFRLDTFLQAALAASGEQRPVFTDDRRTSVGACERHGSAWRFHRAGAGLTPKQKPDLERWYIQEQTYVAHLVTQHIADQGSAVEEQRHGCFGRWLREYG